LSGLDIPQNSVVLMAKIYKKIIPIVHRQLDFWQEKAKQIPNEELKTQAIASICHKTFHCEGGSIYALFAEENREEIIRFIVAYQTISDYLDNLCDRSTSLDSEDFRALHQSMLDALTPGEPLKNYYRLRADQEDGGYLHALVSTCQDVLGRIKDYPLIAQKLHFLATIYCDLQVHKHIQIEKRVPALQNWFAKHKETLPDMTWYEFSACSGSTLGIFYLVSYASGQKITEEIVENVMGSIFPWVQGLHILMDYFVDQSEDKQEGDLNFCFYYEDDAQMRSRFSHFLTMANETAGKLPNSSFQQMINNGLIGIYLADAKVQKQVPVKKIGKFLLKKAGGQARFFYINGKIFRTLRKMVKKVD
jgi:tetraprenyl-beta-curcumene synthase